MASVEQTTGAETTTEQLRVDVELRADLAERLGDDSPAGGDFRKALRSYLIELLESLGIPADPWLEVTSFAATSEDDEPYRIRIGDRACALMQPVELAGDSAPERVAEAIAGGIAANRELFLAPAIVERLRRDWGARSPLVAHAEPSAEAFESVLTDLLNCCVSVVPRPVGETAEHDVPAAPPAGSPEKLREAILADWNAASIRVFVEPDFVLPGSGMSGTSDYDLSQMGETLLDLFLDELGLLLPLVTFEADPALSDGRFRIQINDLLFPPRQGVRASEVLVNAGLDELTAKGIAARSAANPLHGGEAAAVSVDDAAALATDGYVIVRPRAYIAFATSREVRRFAGALLLPDVLAFQLNQLREDDSVVVDAALERFDRYLLSAVFRRLLDEVVPIRDGVGILEGMLAVGSSVGVDQSVYHVIAPDAASIVFEPEGTELVPPSIGDYADCVRRHLRWQVTRGCVDDRDRMRAISVDTRLESRLRQRSRPLDDDERAELRRSVWTIYGPLARAGAVAVVITNSEVRRELRRVLEKEFPALRVLSRHEIAPGTEIQRLGEITWA